MKKVHVFIAFATKKEFSDWIDKESENIRKLAYENRTVIDKKSLEREIELFRTAIEAWTPLRRLRGKKENIDYELIITITNEGYHRFEMTFPITKKDINAAFKYREETKRTLGRWVNCNIPHAIYMTYNEKFKKKFPFILSTFDDNPQEYQIYRQSPLVRVSHVSIFSKPDKK